MVRGRLGAILLPLLDPPHRPVRVPLLHLHANMATWLNYTFRIELKGISATLSRHFLQSQGMHAVQVLRGIRGCARTISGGTSLQNLLSRKGCPFSRSCTHTISFFRVILVHTTQLNFRTCQSAGRQ